MKFYDYNGIAHHTPHTAFAANIKILMKKQKAKKDAEKEADGYARAMRANERRQYLRK